MEYTVHRLAQLAGVSSRTLRYYDEIGILKPARVNSSGYRIYGAAAVDRLQQILFYRELDMNLETIKSIVTRPSFDCVGALAEHRQGLMARRVQLDILIANVDKSIAAIEGRCTMSDREKFKGFVQKMIDDNEAEFGEEVRRKYGDSVVEQSNARLKGMTREQHDESARLAAQIEQTLSAAFAAGDPAGPLAQKAADLHRQWLTFWWGNYSKEAHAGMAQMYVDDERFTAYYDKIQPGTAKFLRDAILVYTGREA